MPVHRVSGDLSFCSFVPSTCWVPGTEMGLVLSVAACLGGGPAGSEMTTAQVQKDVKRALLRSSEHRRGACLDSESRRARDTL